MPSMKVNKEKVEIVNKTFTITLTDEEAYFLIKDLQSLANKSNTSEDIVTLLGARNNQ